MSEFFKKIELKKSICKIRLINWDDMDGLVKIKENKQLHEERFKLQDEDKGRYLGAFFNDNVIGFVLISLQNKQDVMNYTNNEHCADLVDLFIHYLFRNLQIGSTMVNLSEEICRYLQIPYL